MTPRGIKRPIPHALAEDLEAIPLVTTDRGLAAAAPTAELIGGG